MLLTVFVWTFALFVYASNRKNTTNRWVAGSFAFASLGSLKEFLYYDLWASLPYHTPAADEAALTAYSILTAAVYAFGAPLLFFVSLYFAAGVIPFGPVMAQKKRYFLIPGILLLFIYHPANFQAYRYPGAVFWYVFGLYNFIFVAAGTYFCIKAVLAEIDPAAKRQKRFALMLILPPIWYAELSVYIVHMFWIEALRKLWQANVYVLGAGIVVYVALAFREGVMGMRMRRESYRWDTDLKTENMSVGYGGHMLKNEITKIQWSAKNLEKKGANMEELEIIRRSAEHMQKFLEKTQLYAREIKLFKEEVNVMELIQSAIASIDAGGGYSKCELCGRRHPVLRQNPYAGSA